jgi:PAS domain S-box-containing protein
MSGTLGQSFFSELVRYVRFGDADRAALQALHPAAAPSFHEIAEAFYTRLGEHPRAVEVFKSPDQVERLKVSLRAWLDRLLSGPWDEDYFELRSRIGRVHVKVNLPQRYMFTAIAVIHGQLLDVASDACGDDRGRFLATAAALAKILDIELAIMLETYSEDYVAGVQRFERMDKELLKRRLEISEARYEAIVENAEALIVAVDGDGRISLFNRKAEQVSDFRRAEVIGTDCVALLCHPDERAATTVKLAAARTGEGQAFEGRMVTRGGDTRWIRWHLTSLAATGATLICAIGIDVTDERSLQSRTQRAERLASLGTLAAGLAHEIRNPLNAAQLQLMLVDRRINKYVEAEPELGRALGASEIVQSELKRLGGLVNDFLAFARPTALRPGEADLGITVETIASLVAPDLDQAGLTMSLDIEPMSIGRFDEERIKQVLLNLVRNAIEAAGHGGDVSMSVRRDDGALRVEIADSGPGIPEDSDIFEPFVTTKDAGTGLGLPIAHRIVSGHGGELTVERRDDRTVFTVELPIDGPPP